jgi:4-hydroxybenzoate polyprenyltransferase
MGGQVMFASLITTARMIKISHSVFALPFALVAVFLACDVLGQRCPDVGKTALWLACMVSARAFAMTFNRIADFHYDALNPRTAGRELPTGLISRRFAWGFMVLCGGIFVLCCAEFYLLYANIWPVVFALPLLAFLAIYSYTKRFTTLSHFWLGASLGLAPIASWVAFSPPEGAVIGMPAIVLGFAVMLWTAGFDIIYSLADIEFDRQMNLRSIPAALGTDGALLVSRWCHVFTLCWLATLLFVPGLDGLYVAALVLAAAAFFIEHWLIRRSIDNISTAFFTVNGVFGIFFAMLTIADIVWK